MKAGWRQARLNDLCVVDWGNTNLTKAAYVEAGEFLAVSAAGCDGRIGHKEHFKHTPVLSAIGAQCGKMFFPDEDFTAIKNTITLTPREGKCSGRFLYYLLTFVKLPQRGAGQPFISKGDIQSFAVTFPPLPEQQHIVGILDEAFDGIATAKANAEKNLQNARTLFESHLNAVFTQRGKGWVEKPLGEVCRFSSGGTPSKTESRYWNGSIPWVSGRDMKSTRLSDAALHISQEGLDESSTRMAPAGTLLTLVRGMGLAHGAQIAELMVPCAFNQDIRAIYPERNIASRFLLFALRTGINRSENVLSNAAHGTLKIDMDELRHVAIPVPSPIEQERVARQIAALDAETQRLESIYRQKLAALDALKKSLLDQAFNGLL